MNTQSNLVDLADRLTETDIVFLIGKLSTVQSIGVHRGTLMFVRKSIVAATLRNIVADTQSSSQDRRKAKSLLARLNLDLVEPARFKIYFDNKKVYKHKFLSGTSDDNLKIRLPVTANREAGIQWNAFRKRWVKPEVVVNHLAILRRVKGNLWEVTVEKSLEQWAKEYLFQRFSL